jgi:hypothetical protein
LANHADALEFHATIPARELPEDYPFAGLIIFRFDVAPDDSVTVDISANDSSLNEALNMMGDEAAEIRDRGVHVTVGNLEVAPGAVEPLLFPPQLGAYVWYIPEIETASFSDLDDEDIEELRAIGYID